MSFWSLETAFASHDSGGWAAELVGLVTQVTAAAAGHWHLRLTHEPREPPMTSIRAIFTVIATGLAALSSTAAGAVDMRVAMACATDYYAYCS